MVGYSFLGDRQSHVKMLQRLPEVLFSAQIRPCESRRLFDCYPMCQLKMYRASLSDASFVRCHFRSLCEDDDGYRKDTRNIRQIKPTDVSADPALLKSWVIVRKKYPYIRKRELNLLAHFSNLSTCFSPLETHLTIFCKTRIPEYLNNQS